MSHITLAVLSDPNTIWFWVVWGPFLVWQNYAFTYVSRARNSASLSAHAIAAIQSNCVWFLQFMFAVSIFTKIIKGDYGFRMALFAAFYYTVFTMSGSLYAHYQRLHKEEGKTAVGANLKYAQIPIDEWARVKEVVLGEKKP